MAYGNNPFEVRASSALGTTGEGLDFDNPLAPGIRLTLKCTAVSGTSPTLDAKVQVYNSVAGTWNDLPGATWAQVTGATEKLLTIYPGIAETANESVSDHLGRRWRLYYTIGGSSTPTVTFSVEGCYLA